MTKPSHAKTVAPNSPLLLLSKSSLPKKDSPTNPSAASPAAMLAKAIPEVALTAEADKCLTLFVPDAVKIAKYLLNPEMIVRFIAVIVSRVKEDKGLQSTLRGAFSCSLVYNSS